MIDNVNGLELGPDVLVASVTGQKEPFLLEDSDTML